jgi:hypothetical protein
MRAAEYFEADYVIVEGRSEMRPLDEPGSVDCLWAVRVTGSDEFGENPVRVVWVLAPSELAGLLRLAITLMHTNGQGELCVRATAQAVADIAALAEQAVAEPAPDSLDTEPPDDKERP